MVEPPGSGCARMTEMFINLLPSLMQTAEPITVRGLWSRGFRQYTPEPDSEGLVAGLEPAAA